MGSCWDWHLELVPDVRPCALPDWGTPGGIRAFCLQCCTWLLCLSPTPALLAPEDTEPMISSISFFSVLSLPPSPRGSTK